jgi:hypothetical protein
MEREVFMRLGLKEVSYVIKTLGVSDEISDLHGNVMVGDKLYIYEKKGNTLVISGEDGRRLTVAVNVDVKERLDKDGNCYELPKHQVFFEYGLANGEALAFTKELALVGAYEGFEDVNRHDLLTGAKTGYYNAKGEKVASFSTEVRAINLANSDKTFIFEVVGKEMPVQVRHGEMTFANFDGTDIEALKAKAVREKILFDVDYLAITPEAIELVERKFRKDVFDYKNQHKHTK